MQRMWVGWILFLSFIDQLAVPTIPRLLTHDILAVQLSALAGLQ
jgi:hypothetical protein